MTHITLGLQPNYALLALVGWGTVEQLPCVFAVGTCQTFFYRSQLLIPEKKKNSFPAQPPPPDHHPPPSLGSLSGLNIYDVFCFGKEKQSFL